MNSIVRGGESGEVNIELLHVSKKFLIIKKIFYFLAHQKMIQMKFLLCRCALKIKTTYGVDIGAVKKKSPIYILNYATTSQLNGQ